MFPRSFPFLSALLPHVDVDGRATADFIRGSFCFTPDFPVFFCTREWDIPIFHFLSECAGVFGSLLFSIVVPINHWEVHAN